MITELNDNLHNLNTYPHYNILRTSDIFLNEICNFELKI